MISGVGLENFHMVRHWDSLSAEGGGFVGIAPALLEGWMRDYYFDTEIDLGSSGVESFALGDVRRLSGLTQEEMDRMLFDDSRTQGAAGLREAVARRWGDGNSDRVMATHGSSEAIYLIMNALLRAGDEVIVLEPCYQQLASIAEAIGCHTKRWRLPAEQNFAADVGDLQALISPHTRMVVVNFPHNPTGASLTPGGQRDLIRAVAAIGAYLVWDAAFSDLVFTGEPLPNPVSLYERAITLGTLSKAYGLAGLRVGWLFAAPDVISACIHLRDYVTLHLSPLV